MLVEYMLAPPGAEEPQQLRAFWPDASAATPVPAQNTEVLHDFMFRLFATCMYLCGNQNFTARAGSSPLDGASAATSSPRNDLVKNCRVHPTHGLISTQPIPCRRKIGPHIANVRPAGVTFVG